MTTENRLEVMWGVELLDEGFTTIPNLVIRNWAKVGVKPAEWAFLTVLLTFKHDAREPYPSQETLAEALDCHPNQIKRWVKALKEKKLLRIGRRRNPNSKKWGNNVYSIKPLLDAILSLTGQPAMPDVEDYEVEWEDEEQGTQIVSMDPNTQIVSMDSEQIVSMGSQQIVSLKNKSKNKKVKSMDGRLGSEDAASSSAQNVSVPKPKEDQQAEQEFAMFQRWCNDNYNMARDFFRVWKNYYTECPLPTAVAMLRDVIDDQYDFSGNKTEYKNAAGVYHHRMKQWRSMQVMYKADPMYEQYSAE